MKSKLSWILIIVTFIFACFSLYRSLQLKRQHEIENQRRWFVTLKSYTEEYLNHRDEYPQKNYFSFLEMCKNQSDFKKDLVKTVFDVIEHELNETYPVDSIRYYNNDTLGFRVVFQKPGGMEKKNRFKQIKEEVFKYLDLKD